jgi:sec-independent protein translocase protein TatC
MINDIDETQAPLLEHLLELRTRLLRCIYALAIALAICFYFSDGILGILVHPLAAPFPKAKEADLHQALRSVLRRTESGAVRRFLCPFPIIANQLWAFVAPGLYAREKKAFLPFLVATPILFAGGRPCLFRGHADCVPLVHRVSGDARRASARSAAGG